MPFTIVVVTPLIATMKDQVEHLNKIGVTSAMMGEDLDEAVKSGSCAFSLLELTICIETAFYRNERYLVVT